MLSLTIVVIPKIVIIIIILFIEQRNKCTLTEMN